MNHYLGKVTKFQLEQRIRYLIKSIALKTVPRHYDIGEVWVLYG